MMIFSPERVQQRETSIHKREDANNILKSQLPGLNLQVFARAL